MGPRGPRTQFPGNYVGAFNAPKGWMEGLSISITLLYLFIHICSPFQACQFHLFFLVIASILQDIEATIHCAEWLSIVGGSSTGDQRVRY